MHLMFFCFPFHLDNKVKWFFGRIIGSTGMGGGLSAVAEIIFCKGIFLGSEFQRQTETCGYLSYKTFMHLFCPKRYIFSEYLFRFSFHFQFTCSVTGMFKLTSQDLIKFSSWCQARLLDVRKCTET